MEIQKELAKKYFEVSHFGRSKDFVNHISNKNINY